MEFKKGINLQRHQLLKILSKQRLKASFNKTETPEYLGIKIKELMTKLKCTREHLHLITCGLVVEEELLLDVQKHRKDEANTFYVSDKGVLSYTQSKYKKLHYDRIWWIGSNLSLISGMILTLLNINGVFSRAGNIESQKNEIEVTNQPNSECHTFHDSLTN